jgi:hypothetical protein
MRHGYINEKRKITTFTQTKNLNHMINIELTPEQAEELMGFYTIELEKIQKRVNEINGLIDKLKGKIHVLPEPAIKQIEENVPKKVDLKYLTDTSIEKETLKEMNQRWSSFILQVLQDKQSPLSRKDITKVYEQLYNKNISNSEKVQAQLQQALFRLSARSKKIECIKKKGMRNNLYKLISKDKNINDAPKTTEKAKAKNANPRKIEKLRPKTVIIRDNKPPLTFTYNWPKFILDTLNKTKRVLSTKEFVPLAMVHFNVPKHDNKKIRNSLSRSLSYLEQKANKIKSLYKEGKAGRFYGLPEWFDNKGNSITKYI